MIHTRVLCGCLVAGICASAGTLRAQDVPVTRVRLAIRNDPPDTAQVTIRNLRDQPLVAWKLAVDGGAVVSAGAGALPAGESHTTSLKAVGARAATVSIVLAVFADGYVEGHPALVREYREYRARLARDARYWLQVLDGLPAGHDDIIRAFLKDRLVERERAKPVESIFAAQMRDAILDDRSRPPGAFRQQLAEARAAGKKRLARYEQPLITSSTVPEGLVVSVALTSRPFASGPMYATVENVGPRAVEAITLDYIEQGSNRSVHSQFLEFTSELRADVRDGPIGPKQAREIRLPWDRPPEASSPRVAVRYVLFEDLSWEGSAAEHARVMTSRERRAAAADYWIATLNDIAGHPPEKAREQLAARRIERAALDRFRTDSSLAHHIDRLIDPTRTSSADFPSHAAAAAAALASLRDHLIGRRSP